MEQDPSQFSTLVDVIARLRGPDGCPWDREQTHASLRECLLEECYEVLEALDEADSGQLSVELGDLLMRDILVDEKTDLLRHLRQLVFGFVF